MWRDQAACKDTDPGLFFDTSDEAEAEALAICAGCPVQQACLAEAMHAEYGVQGGMTADQRKALLGKKRPGPAGDTVQRLLVQLVVPRTRTTLARLLDCTSSYVGRLLHELEAEGLVRSEPGRYWPPRADGNTDKATSWHRVA